MEQTEKFLEEEQSTTDYKFSRKRRTETERFKLLDLSWEAWRHDGQKIEQNPVLDVQTSSMFCRRCAISEELEKHIWYKGCNIREIRRYVIVITQLTKYGLV